MLPESWISDSIRTFPEVDFMGCQIPEMPLEEKMFDSTEFRKHRILEPSFANLKHILGL